MYKIFFVWFIITAHASYYYYKRKGRYPRSSVSKHEANMSSQASEPAAVQRPAVNLILQPLSSLFFIPFLMKCLNKNLQFPLPAPPADGREGKGTPAMPIVNGGGGCQGRRGEDGKGVGCQGWRPPSLFMGPPSSPRYRWAEGEYVVMGIRNLEDANKNLRIIVE